MNSSMLDMQVATAPVCSRSARSRGLGHAVPANAIFGAATGGFWTLDPFTTKHRHSLRERRT